MADDKKVKDEQQVTCAHPACSCPPAPNSKYCSEYCKDARDTLEIMCNCKHPGCS